MKASKQSKFRLTLSSLQICRSKSNTTSLVTSPLPKNLVFSPFNHKSFEIKYPNLPEPPPSTPTDLSGIWDAPPEASSQEQISRPWKSNKGSRVSRFKNEENSKKEILVKAKEDICSSSEETNWSSVEGNEETESLVSSVPSSNSSPDKKPIHEPCSKNMNSGKLKQKYSSNKTRLEQLIPCIADGKVDESYALLKRSKSPTEDFKKSMMEMIIEKQMFGVDKLEQLLSCFLSLNSPQHHAAIVSAFAEVWMALFSQPGCPPEL